MAENERGKQLDSSPTAVLYDSDNKQTFFVEGIGQFSVGPSVSKIGYFKVVSAEMRESHTFEERELSIEITIPTIAIFQWMASVSSQLGSLIPSIEQGSMQSLDLIKQFLNTTKK